jgi:hypothetical protein
MIGPEKKRLSLSRGTEVTRWRFLSAKRALPLISGKNR